MGVGDGVSGCVGVGWGAGGRYRWRLCGYECVWRGGVDGVRMRVWVWRDRLTIVMIVRVPVNLFTVMIVRVPINLFTVMIVRVPINLFTVMIVRVPINLFTVTCLPRRHSGKRPVKV